ncbi:MAG: hypothetical protein L6461_17865 [Anaerolineae bacterium]|nr:hypothetical protein [Anaerolineae bacterium]
MNKKTSMGITVTILLILLLARFTYFAFILFRYDYLVLESVYLLLNYSLITLVTRIHKSQLHMLNLDRNSMFLFILLGVTYAVFLYQSVGVLIFLMVIYNRYLLSQNLTFAKTELSLKSILLGVLGVLVVLIYFWVQPDTLSYNGNIEGWTSQDLLRFGVKKA